MVKSGRTHLMDAVPITLGQEAGAWAAQVRYGVERLKSRPAAAGRAADRRHRRRAAGSTRRRASARPIAEELADLTGLPLTEARNHFEAQASQDSVVETSGQLRTVAVSLIKIANDLRWLGSGPRTGLAELALPDLQPGSSIMPGKVNPVIPRGDDEVVAQVIGNDAAVAFAGAAGQLPAERQCCR